LKIDRIRRRRTVERSLDRSKSRKNAESKDIKVEEE